nr:hypothetical protein [Tanacetum cinerariifolium]
MITFIHLAKHVKAAEFNLYEDVILDVCCQNIASDDEIWEYVVEMSVLLVTSTQQNNSHSSWYEKLLNEMLSHLWRQPRSKERRISWLKYIEPLFSGMDLVLLGHFRRIFLLFFKWMHANDDESVLLRIEACPLIYSFNRETYVKLLLKYVSGFRKLYVRNTEDFLEDLFPKQPSGNPTFSPHQEITSPEVTHEIHVLEGCNFLSEELPDIDSFNDIHPFFDDNPLSGSTTYSSNSLLEEFTDELALITYPPDYDDNLQFDIESDLKEIEFLLYQGKDSDLKDSIDQTDLVNFDAYFVDPTPEMFNDEHAPDYSFPSRFDVYPDDFLEIEFDADNFYDDPFDSKGEKIKEFKLLIDELDLPCDFLPYSEYDSFASQDFSRDDVLPSPDNEDKVFNPGILIQEKSVTIITRVAQEKKLAISKASLVFEDFDPPFYEPLVFKDVPKSMRLLPFSSENEENVFKPGIYTSEKVKEKQEKEKIGSKPDKKREAWRSQAVSKASHSQ